MQFHHASAEFVLNENFPLAACNARGVIIRCTVGCVWITIAGKADDVFLAAGESWVCDGDGLLLIDALKRAQVMVEAPASRLSRTGGLRRLCTRLWQACRPGDTWQHGQIA